MTLAPRILAGFLAAVYLLLPSLSARAGERGELVFGMSAAFTGANSELGIEYFRGLMAYLDYVNRSGGVEGWTIKVVPANDSYNPDPCFQNTIRFITQDKVFALFSYVGTPTATRILPLLKRFENDDYYLLFPLTGAEPLRQPPYGSHVYNLRASYFQETSGLVDHLVELGRSRIGVFYQADAYGRTGWDGVLRALTKHGLSMVSEAAYRRGASFERSYIQEAKYLLAGNPDAIVCIGTYASGAGLIRDIRRAGFKGPIANVSFCDSGKMLELLYSTSMGEGEDLTENLIHTQVVPSYDAIRLPGVQLYQKLMAAAIPLPTGTVDGYVPRRHSYVSFEGFLNAMVLVEMVKRMADDPRRDRIPEALESMTNLDLGIGVNVCFGPGDHQGLEQVYFTTVRDGRFREIENWELWRK